MSNDIMPIHGIMTFGQPMIADPGLARYLDTALWGKFAHFVNDADIVPRIPPGMKHCGSLVWFNQDSIYRSKRRVYGANDVGANQVTIDEDILPPLSLQEFQKVKSEIRSSQHPQPNDDKRVYQGGMPIVDDHDMDRYVERVNSLFRTEVQRR